MVDDVQKADVKMESKVGGFVKTVVSFIVLIVVLVVAYLAVRSLVGTDINLDTLMTGRKVSSLPRLP